MNQLPYDSNIDLFINRQGSFCVVVDDPVPLRPEWAEFDRAGRTLHVYDGDGRHLQLGVIAADALQPFIVGDARLLLVEMQGDAAKAGYDIPLMVLEAA